MINIVTNNNIINYFKRSQYFKVNLGLAITLDKSGRRDLNKADLFSYSYNAVYNTVIFAKGNIGDIRFYVDGQIIDDVMAFYIGETFEEFIYDFDKNMSKEKTVENYLGYLIKETEIKYEKLIEDNKIKQAEPVKEGNADKVISNPGNVSWEDVKAYMEKKNQSRRI